MVNLTLRWQTLAYVLFILLSFGCEEGAYFDNGGSSETLPGTEVDQACLESELDGDDDATPTCADDGTDGGIDGGVDGGDDGGTDGGDDGGTDGGDDGGTDGGDDGGTDGGDDGGTDGGTDGSNPNLINKSDSFNQNQNSDGKIDFLWVVDNSGSMQDEQDNLATNFADFIQNFISYDTDFKMAIVTTDTKNGGFGEPVPGSLAALTSSQASNDEASFLTNFADMIRVGVNGSGKEQGLRGADGFLSNYGETGANAFLRDDAHLAIIYVSDEEDQSPLNPANYIQNILNQKTDDEVIISSIVNMSGGDAQQGIQTGYARYAEVTEHFDGSIKDIKSDFHETLVSLSNIIIDKLISFELNGTPYNVDDIEVYVNDSLVDSSNYEYIEDSNSIRFNQNSIPDYGDSIRVDYQVEQ